MTAWSAVPQQARAVDLLRRASAGGDPGHAWAFVGPAGVGQQEAARALFAALTCPTPPDGEPCGTCKPCTAALAGAAGDYHEFSLRGPMYRVEDVREDWLRTAFLSAAGAWKVLRVLEADRMNEAAANAFLKGLEEPPERTVWILDIADPDELPDTILSRCRALRFAPWTVEALADRARAAGLAEPDVAVAARAASGSPPVLDRLARPGGMDDLRAHREVFTRLREAGPGYALVAARRIAEEVERATAASARREAEELREVSRSHGGVELSRKLQGVEDALLARPVRELKAKDLQDLASAYAEALPKAAVRRVREGHARLQREEKVRTAQAAIDDMVGWLRDVVVVGAGGDPAAALHVDAPDALRADAQALGAAMALRAVDVLLATREGLERNAQQGLALEACFMEISALTLAAAGR